MEILFKFVKNDDKVFSQFKPTKNTIGKMEIARIINSKQTLEQDLGLEFALFLLRYCKNIAYDDLSLESETQNKIKRAETFRVWQDIEDLAMSHEKILENFNTH
jgi:hypothetical protein